MRELILKYRLHHIFFWGFYHYCWWTIAMGNPVKAAIAIFTTWFFIKYSFYVLFHTLSAWVNLYWLMPRYLEKNSLAGYIIGLSTCIIGTSVAIIPGYYLSAAAMHQPVRILYNLQGTPILHLFFGNTFPATLASITLGMSIRLTNNWIQTRRRQQLLEKDKLASELSFLKHQFNPHFLFNTINSIFFLIHKNPDKASASLAKFSELLRHQLYECNDQQIALTKEIAYLENFIQLQRLRQNDNVDISFQLRCRQTENLGIAPFILMTFVENAFKHVSTHADKPNWIKIDLQTHHQQLNFSISNSHTLDPHTPDPHTSDPHNPDPPAPSDLHTPHTSGPATSVPPGPPAPPAPPGGIGLHNVRRRLDLLYAGQYQLDIQNNNTTFTVHLQLQTQALNENYAELCYR